MTVPVVMDEGDPFQRHEQTPPMLCPSDVWDCLVDTFDRVEVRRLIGARSPQYVGIIDRDEKTLSYCGEGLLPTWHCVHMSYDGKGEILVFEGVNHKNGGASGRLFRLRTYDDVDECVEYLKSLRAQPELF